MSLDVNKKNKNQLTPRISIMIIFFFYFILTTQIILAKMHFNFLS